MDTTGLALLISVAALVLGVATYHLKRRETKRAELRERLQSPQLSLYLRDAATELVGETKYRIWRFALLITNSSDRENSVVSAACGISYRTNGEHIHNVAIPVHVCRAENLASDSKLNLPLWLNGRDAKAGVLSFGAPDSVLAGRDIVGYVVTLEDANGKEYQAETIVVIEAGGEDEEAILEAGGQGDTGANRT